MKTGIMKSEKVMKERKRVVMKSTLSARYVQTEGL